MSLGSFLKKKRLELQLTQVDLAKRLGVGQNYVAYLENDERKPSHEILQKLSDSLAVPFDKLYFLEHPEMKEKFSSQESNNDTTPPPLLKALRNNTRLKEQYKITAVELDLLGSVRARGELRDQEGYVNLLMTIRKVYQK